MEPTNLVRALTGGCIELRAAGDGTADDVLGVMDIRFARFNAWNEIHDWWEGDFLERLNPGAFTKTMRERADQIKVLFNHGHDAGGRVALGSIADMGERPDGPYGVVELHDNSVTRDLLPGLRRGIYGASYMFRVIGEERNEKPGESKHNPKGLPERTITEVKLMEFGPVTFPADEGTTAGVRSLTSMYLPAHVLATRHDGGPATPATDPPVGQSAGIPDASEPPTEGTRATNELRDWWDRYLNHLDAA